MRCCSPFSLRLQEFLLRFLSGLRLAHKQQLMLTVTKVGCAVVALACASGCHRVVLVPESSPVRLAADTKATVYTLVDGDWVRGTNTVVLSEGWYIVPPSFVEDNE